MPYYSTVIMLPYELTSFHDETKDEREMGKEKSIVVDPCSRTPRNTPRVLPLQNPTCTLPYPKTTFEVDQEKRKNETNRNTDGKITAATRDTKPGSSFVSQCHVGTKKKKPD